MSENATPKKASDHVPYAADQGLDYLAGAAKAGLGLQAKKITQAGAPPFTVVLEDHGLVPMADADYVVIVGGETVGVPKVDESTMTKTGFDILGGADTEVLHVLIAGRLKGMAG